MGIGLELCRQIHKRGDNVIATCRKASKELIKKAKIFLSSKFNQWKFLIKNLYKRLLG